MLKHITAATFNNEKFVAIAVTSFLKGISTFLTFLISVLLARSMTLNHFSEFYFYLSLVFILAIPIRLGLPQLILREVSANLELNNISQATGVIVWSIILITSISTCGIVLFLMFASHVFSEKLYNLYLICIFIVPIVSLLSLSEAVLRAIGKLRLSQVPNSVVVHVSFISIVIYLYWILNRELTAEIALIIQFSTSSLALFLGALLCLRYFPKGLKGSSLTFVQQRSWWKAIVPLALSGGIQQIIKRSDVVMLGFLSVSMSGVGVYKISAQLALLSIFFLGVVNTVDAPVYSRLYANKKINLLKKRILIASRIALFTTSITAMTFIIYGESIISIIYGRAYTDAYFPLVILLIGYVLASFFGPVDTVLNMVGGEKGTLRGVLFGLTINIILNFALIPSFGAIGAAFATSISMCASRFLQYRSLLRLRKIECSALQMR